MKAATTVAVKPAYYNEFDKYAAQWLRNLIAAGHIAPGDVDDRSIEDVRPSDLDGYAQCHFFAGVGVWSYALRLAGWPDDRPVWTGSCPCQPFSAAGEGAGFADERHLWPAFHHLIGERSPPTVLGEQVASKDANPWIDLVCTDMEALGYSFGAVPFPSAGVGAPHIRDRAYWVAHANNARLEGWWLSGKCAAELVAGSGRVAGQTNGFWENAEWVKCDDGERPVEPFTFPLAHGAPSRVGRLRAYGNAINAEAARVFIAAVMECAP
ncbi:MULTISPECIES: DNA cytosine methyltransferase [unclassified Acidovorax]|uniref:DNA cytosine methyltransferase n=1 Tax=unclassified Acidovorax TaxID=2684926 RepID=UPI001C47BBD3|nr:MULTISPECIES: DNA cytosine methyltransferase [unclassified Acidovorax]MBV7460483.1 DNA cytosine methyltransferase [Acidovorax sp. sif0632]MBV7465508.1 DNA cytosine methyltransferase [Acidovorax sp. sif0613]